MKKIRELYPNYDRARSFYGKAFIHEDDKTITLQSYQTNVIRYDKKAKQITRLWSEYSVTTMRHVNEFMRSLETTFGGKNWWDNLPVGEAVTICPIGGKA